MSAERQQDRTSRWAPGSRRSRSAQGWFASDDGARWAFRSAFAVAAVALYLVGRLQWFIRDDWAFVISRNAAHRDFGTGVWLFSAQDGHWLTVPILLFRAIQLSLGLGSYWPYLLTCLATHIGSVLLVRVLCRRAGVSAWTTTLVCAVLLVFGNGWENIVFAIQVTYNLSLFCFLAHVVLADHDGPVDRRDYLGVAVGLIGLMSSGFGPFFIVGIGAFLVLRRRWRAALTAVVPLALAYGWWWLRWGVDSASDSEPASFSVIPEFTLRGLVATFDGLVGIAALSGIALLATLTVVLWRRPSDPAGPFDETGGVFVEPRQALLIALGGTTVVMFAGIGLQRAGYGMEAAQSSRYVYMGALLIAVPFAVAVDQLRRLSGAALAAGRTVLITAAVLNAGALYIHGSAWARWSACERNALALVAGSPKTATVAPTVQPLTSEPNLSLGDLPELIREHAVTPRPPVSPAELALVDQALAASNSVCPRPSL